MIFYDETVEDKPKRFQRTGEFRVPIIGEWFEYGESPENTPAFMNNESDLEERKPMLIRIAPFITARWILEEVQNARDDG